MTRPHQLPVNDPGLLDKIDAYHRGEHPEGMELHTFLGMTLSEYMQWATQSLPVIEASAAPARRHRGFRTY